MASTVRSASTVGSTVSTMRRPKLRWSQWVVQVVISMLPRKFRWLHRPARGLRPLFARYGIYRAVGGHKYDVGLQKALVRRLSLANRSPGVAPAPAQGRAMPGCAPMGQWSIRSSAAGSPRRRRRAVASTSSSSSWLRSAGLKYWQRRNGSARSVQRASLSRPVGLAHGRGAGPLAAPGGERLRR